MQIYPNAYYNYKKDKKAAYEKEKAAKQQAILEIYQTYNGRPGHRMMVIYLKRRGILLSKTTVLKYMKELGIRSVVVRKKREYAKGECYKKFENHLNGEFQAERKNEKWCTDFTYLYLADGSKRYNCSILDLYDKSIVATQNGSRLDAQLAIDTLEKALRRNNVRKNILLHSDQGSQYTSKAFTDFCEKKQIQQSMSKAGCPYDNAAMESFYGTFKAEFTKQTSFTTDEQLNKATEEYVYGYYNHIRPHSSNGYLTPFEKRYC